MSSVLWLHSLGASTDVTCDYWVVTLPLFNQAAWWCSG